MEQLFLAEGAPWQGLALAGRCLAAWARLRDVHAELLTTHQVAELAAAIHRLVAMRAGDKGLFRETAAAFRADEALMRRADAQVRKLLSLSSDRRW